ncbi:RNA polymerase sigma factor FliA [Amnimonas aquatica]|uniref:RNA polymerase sigma factor n=1 Tax=Amnimonas aquatica TaxID=2094561 RepID=A0A2P6ATF4_9GAMM|nr:RNA polymerase sigma factor FliA [Amnimonas aquatica]
MNASAAYRQVHRGSRDELVLRHAALVKRQALHLRGRLSPSQDLDDLIQAGMIGLLEAASNYEGDKGASFETYAAIRVRGAMMDQLRRGGWAPRSVARTAREIGEARNRVEQRLRREAAAAEVAAELAVDLETYHAWLRDAEGLYLASLDQIIDEHPETAVLGGEDSATPLRALMGAGFEQSLAEEIGRLPEREKLVMSLYYEQNLNMKEIGLVMDVTESRVCQLHAQAVGRLRKALGEWAGETA